MKKDLDLDELRRGAELARRKMRHEVRQEKLKEIMKAWEDLFFILAGEDVYKKYSGGNHYSSFEKRIRQGFEKSWQKHLAEGKFTEKDIGPPGVLLDSMGDLLKVNYLPPPAGEDIATDLILLKEYYRSNFFSPSVEMALDLSLCKLIGAVNRLYGAARVRGETILTAKNKQKEEVASSRTAVFEAFHALGIKNKSRYKSKRRIAQDIKNYLISKNKEILPEERQKVPSEKTIIRYIESDEKVRNDLIAMGVIKEKSTLVQ